MKLRLAMAGVTVSLVVACATPYDPKEQKNIGQMEREPSKSLDELLPPMPSPTPRPTAAPLDEESLSSPEATKRAMDNYRKILELSPDNRIVKWEAQRRLADLQVEVSELDPEAERKGIASTDNSIDLYNSLLDSRPQDPDNDRILYQLARAYQNTGQVDEAIEALTELTRAYPDTRLWTDAQFRRAELLFNRREYAGAEDAYRQVMGKGPDTAYFEQAQYKFGWSIFKQERYAEALDSFLPILDRELPVGAVENLDSALAVVTRAQRELVRDVLRVVSLSFSYLGGGPAITDYLKGKPVRSYEPVLYDNLAALFLDKSRFDDAARTYAGLADRSPTHALAPIFQARVIEVYDKAGFADMVLKAKVDYVEKYDLDQVYWTAHDRQDSPEAYELLRSNMEELARHWHASAQKLPAGAGRNEMFKRATQTYARYLSRFEDADNRPQINFLLAEAHFQNADFEPAAQEYARTAWDYPAHEQAAEAGYAAVLSRQKLVELAQAEARAPRVRDSVAVSLRFADTFPRHPEHARVLMRAAEDLYATDEADQAIEVATRVTTLTDVAGRQLHAPAWTLIGYAHMDQSRFAQAEAGLSQALALLPAQDAKRGEVRENLATAIYRQGEAARDAEDLPTAIGHFLRVKQAMPGSALAAAGDFDAAAALISQEDWGRAAEVLLSFRQSYPQHEFQRDVTRKLAAVYLKDDKPLLAAAEYERIARTPQEGAEAQQAAAWEAAQLYDGAKAGARAEAAYAWYVERYPRPYDQLLRAQERLIEMTEARGDTAANRRWLGALISAERAAGAESTPRARTLAAKASLTMADDARRQFERLRITASLNASLPPKKAAMDRALTAYNTVAQYAIAEFATEAAFRTGELYANFSRSLMQSERPRGLSELELEEYQFLLEDQAFPLEEKAIEIHAANTQRTRDGIYDEWVRASYAALAKLLPARYNKIERTEVTLETLD